MTSTNETRVIFQESPRDFRTEIPNVVFELLESGEISNSDFILYSNYRRIAGEHGACWVGSRGLAKKCNLDAKTITKSKINLSRPFDILGGKSLIEITPCDRKSETPDTVTIIDIWRENHNFFKNKLTCGKRTYTGVGKEHTRVWEMAPHKKERYKKEPIEEESKKEKKPKIVHNSDPPEVSFVSASPPLAEGSFPFSKKNKEEDLFSPELLELLDLEPEYEKHFRPKIVSIWIKKFGATMVLETVKYFFKTLATQKKPIDAPEKWMEKAFKDGYAEKEITCKINKEFAEKLKKEYRLGRLKINKRYCQDTETGKDYYYNLPKKVFEAELSRIKD